MLKYSATATGIMPVSFLVAGMGSFIDLDRSYLEVELQLNNVSTNGIMADTNASLSDQTNTRFTYVTNNIGHTLLKQMNLYMNGIVMSVQTNT